MKTVGYIGALLPDGHLSVAPDVARRLDLRPDNRVQVVLIPLPKADEQTEAGAAARAQIWQRVDTLRHRLSDKGFSLNEALLRAGEEEEAAG
jgi:hypothetical protein